MNLQDQGILPNKEEGSRGQRCKKVFADSELSLFRELPEWTPDAEVDGTGRGGGWHRTRRWMAAVQAVAA